MMLFKEIMHWMIGPKGKIIQCESTTSVLEADEKLRQMDILLSNPYQWEPKSDSFHDAVQHKTHDLYFYTDQGACTIRNGKNQKVCDKPFMLYERWKIYSDNIAKHCRVKDVVTFYPIERREQI